MQDLKELAERARIRLESTNILLEELRKSGIEDEFADVDVLNAKTSGVQGDGATYSYAVRIILEPRRTFYELSDFLPRVSTRITNEVRGVNRPTYSLA